MVADGYYEWQKIGKQKQPYFIHRTDDAPLGFAGLWERWRDVETCTIITTGANELTRPIHDRMPAVISPDDYALWLDRENEDSATLCDLLRPRDVGPFTATPVSTLVNSPKNDVPECVVPVDGSGA